jgi:hypothetical protein
MWNGCSEIREGENGTGRNTEDGKKIEWMKEIWKRRNRMEKEKKNILFVFVVKIKKYPNSKSFYF